MENQVRDLPESWMRIVAVAAKWLFILCLPVLLFTASVAWAVNSSWLYERGIEKYSLEDVRARGLERPAVDGAVRGLIAYFNSDEQSINVTVLKDGRPFRLFNERETIHLKDVKGLVLLDYRVLLGTLLYVLAFAIFYLRWGNWQRVASGLAWGSGITLGLMLALGLGILVGFDRVFLSFHLISFSNEFWQLDPARDYLLMLFPQRFWYDAFVFVVTGIVVGAVVLGGTGGWLVWKDRREKGKDRGTFVE